MMKLLLLTVLFVSSAVSAQSNYSDSTNAFIQDYIAKHEVVTGNDRQHLHFFEINKNYHVQARFERTENSPWFKMETSGVMRPLYRVFGKAHFSLNDTTVTLNIYQSQSLMQMEKYKDDLFIPFTDATSGVESYDGGRYIDLSINDISDNSFLIDFNKAYNPYCAYVSNKYNCPIPPKENRLAVAISAGEKKYGKAH